MPRLRFTNLQKGLWLNGGRDSIPEGALRRAKGVSQINEGLLRSAPGYRTINAHTALQYCRFAGSLYQGEGVNVRRDGVIIDSTQSGLRLSFLRMPPSAAKEDYIFFAGGGSLKKSDSAGNVTNWGIAAPTTALTLTKVDPDRLLIDSMEVADASNWKMVSGSGSVAADASVKVEGSNSILLTTGASLTATVMEKTAASMTADLNNFSVGTASADQDYIEFYFRCDDPEHLAGVQIAFSLGDTSFNNAAYVRRIEVVDDRAERDLLGVAQAPTLPPGMHWGPSLPGVERRVVAEEGEFAPSKSHTELLEQTGQSVLPRVADTWTKMRVSKASFELAGSSAYDWSDVKAARFTVFTDGSKAIGCHFDWLSMVGGAGLMGKYQYCYTYYNSTTGHRSNASPVATIEDVDRQRVTVTGVVPSGDGQVDYYEFWRTLGNGELFFLVQRNALANQFLHDSVADFPGMFTGSHLVTGDLPRTLSTDELPTDNAVPDSSWGHVARLPYAQRAWWTWNEADGYENRVGYSAIGRPEAEDGFVLAGSTDDGTRCSLVWNDVLYVFTRRHLFRVVNLEEPFDVQEVTGAPGTWRIDTVVGTPSGIMYQADDGIRIFNGVRSEVVGMAALAPIFRGETVEGVAPFVGTTATFARNEYIISDGTTTLAFDISTSVWRQVDLALSAVHSEPSAPSDADTITAALSASTIEFEDLTGATTGTTFEIQTGSIGLSTDADVQLQRLHIDIDTGDQEITPTVILDSTEVTLGVVKHAARATVEYPINRQTRRVALRLGGTSILDEVKVYEIAYDVYIPDEAQAA